MGPSKNVTRVLAYLVVSGILLFPNLAFAKEHALAQTRPKVEIKTYPNGKPRSKETTRYGPDGKTILETVKTQYNEDGKPTTEEQTTYKDGVKSRVVEKIWNYDGQGRLIFFSEDNEAFGTGVGPNVKNRYRIKIKYANADDKKGISEEEVFNSVTDKWRPFDSDYDQTPSKDPLQPAKTANAELPGQDSTGIPVSYSRVELFGGYSLTREDGDAENNTLNGWNSSLAVNLTAHVAVRGDVSGFYRSDGNIDISKHLFVFGPQFSYRPNSRVRLFARPLFGVAHFNAETRLPGTIEPISFSDNAFAMALGSGVDVRLNNYLMVRLGQFDYQPTFFGETRQDNFRFSTGLVLTFGGGNSNIDNEDRDESAELKKFRAARRAAEEARKLKDKAKEQLDEAEKEGIGSMSPAGKSEWEQANSELEDARAEAASARNASIEADGEANAQKTPEAVSKAQAAKLAKVRADLKLEEANARAEEKKTKAMTPEARQKYIKARNEYRETSESFDRLSKEAMEAQDAWERAR